jgi:predicted ester cyclase
MLLRFNRYDDGLARQEWEAFQAEREGDVQAIVDLPASERAERLVRDLRQNLPEDASYVRRLYSEAAARASRLSARSTPQRPCALRMVHGSGRQRRASATGKRPSKNSSEDPDPDGSAANQRRVQLNADEMKAVVDIFRTLHSWGGKQQASKGLVAHEST